MPSLTDLQMAFYNQGSDSSIQYNTATAPAAGSLVTIPVPPAGLYEVTVSIRITTGANASLADNLRIRQGTAEKRRILHAIVAANSTVVLPDVNVKFRVDGINNTINLSVVATEAASVVYAACITARKVSD
jgi:hypothetical protein